MTDQMTEGPTTDGEPAVFEDDPQHEERMEELDERIKAQGGVEPEEPDTATRGGFGSPQTMIAEAKKHLGYRETGENDTKFNRWLGRINGYKHDGFGYPWCHSFVSYCLWHSDNADAGPRTAGCLAGVAWFKQRGRYSSTPQVGDIVYYGAEGGTHVELVVGVGPTTLTTIGGNTSGSVDGKAFFNGNGVYQKTVQRSSRIHGYGRPLYSSAAMPVAGGGGGGDGGAAGGFTPAKPLTSVRSVKQQQLAVNSLGYAPPLDVDGDWGPKTAAGVKWLQQKVGAGVDGEWGLETERHYTAFAK